jgi:hypothetical protein
MMKMGSDIEYLDLSLNLAEISSKRSCKMDEQYPAYYQQLTVPMGTFGKEIPGQWLGLVNSTNGLSKRWRLQRFPQRTYVPDRLDLPVLQPSVSQLCVALAWDCGHHHSFNTVYPPTLSV